VGRNDRRFAAKTRDQSAQELKSLIEAKLAGRPAEATAAPPRAILSLLDALKESVQAGNGKAAPSRVKEKSSRKRARRTA
jgi:non-homologous end joining protein Ku